MNIEAINNTVDDFDESADRCPFCKNVVPDYVNTCVFCGLKIRDIDFEEHAGEKFYDAVEQLTEDLANILTGVTDEEIDMNEIDEFLDMKIFFKEHMHDYDYDEFLEFYKSSDEGLEIEEIRDSFLNDKFNKSLGTDEEFHTYFIELIHYFYYSQENNRFDDAFVKLVQMAILASNRSSDKENILMSNPHSIDIDFAIGDMENSNYSFDVDSLFKKAADTFKIEKYNKNHDEVLKELKEYF